MMASGWVKIKTLPAGAPFRNHFLMKHNPGRNRVFSCSCRTSIELKFSQMSCSGYRPLKDIFPLRGAVGSDDVDRTDDGFDFARSDLPDECLAMPKLDPRAWSLSLRSNGPAWSCIGDPISSVSSLLLGSSGSRALLGVMSGGRAPENGGGQIAGAAMPLVPEERLFSFPL
jgi:hypothetical protein